MSLSWDTYSKTRFFERLCRDRLMRNGAANGHVQFQLVFSHTGVICFEVINSLFMGQTDFFPSGPSGGPTSLTSFPWAIWRWRFLAPYALSCPVKVMFTWQMGQHQLMVDTRFCLLGLESLSGGLPAGRKAVGSEKLTSADPSKSPDSKQLCFPRIRLLAVSGCDRSKWLASPLEGLEICVRTLLCPL